MKIKVNDTILTIGDTVTDGYKTYVLGRDYNFHFVDAGMRANERVTPKELKQLVSQF